MEPKRNYLVNCQYLQDRTGDYNLRDKIVAKWEIGEKSDFYNTSANVAYETVFKDGKFQDRKGYEEGEIFISSVIPSALLMYRLVCLFFESPLCEDEYKFVWQYPLIHKETGHFVGFGEWKGWSDFWMKFRDNKALPKKFKSDVFELLDFLVSDKVPHPYDGVVAGSVA